MYYTYCIQFIIYLVYKSTKSNQKYRVINCIMAEDREIWHTLIFKLRGFQGNVQTVYLGNRLYKDYFSNIFYF